MIRVSADADVCVSGGQCVVAAPDVFDQNDDDGTVVLLEPNPPDEAAAAVRQAMRLCPALAITLVDEP